MFSLFCLVMIVVPMAPAEIGPADAKAQKSFSEGEQYLKQHRYSWALDSFKKAAKQDGHCIACDREIVHLALDQNDYKAAVAAAQELTTLVHNPQDIATAHYLYGASLLRMGIAKHGDEYFTKADGEFSSALQANPSLNEALFADGMTLAWLKQDDASKHRFAEYLKVTDSGSAERKRALRYKDRPELVRARMAPAFNVKTTDGREVSLDDLAGKVVLIDFWATWCGPCRESLPRIQQIARKFNDQPLVILSVSLDSDEGKWKEFIASHKMTWLQYRDGGFTGPISTLFGVRAIPSTFTIDADGVLQDQHVGDAEIERKLKKLTAQVQTGLGHAQSAAPPVSGAESVN